MGPTTDLDSAVLDVTGWDLEDLRSSQETVLRLALQVVLQEEEGPAVVAGFNSAI